MNRPLPSAKLLQRIMKRTVVALAGTTADASALIHVSLVVPHHTVGVADVRERNVPPL